jgi:hypothetical protein
MYPEEHKEGDFNLVKNSIDTETNALVPSSCAQYAKALGVNNSAVLEGTICMIPSG